MSLNLLTSALKIEGRNSMSIQAWAQSEDLRARKVARFRAYADGDHDANMTPEMRNLLNRKGRTAEDSHEFNDNVCAAILDTPLDRIRLETVRASDRKAQPKTPQKVEPPKPGEAPKAEADPLNDWVKTLLEDNRIDALQVDVHEATLRDGNTFLMVYPELENKGTPDERTVVRISHEPAYDGSFGMVVMYETTASKKPLLAIKVWKITSTEIADTVRVNVYYEDRIERFASQTASVNGTPVISLQPYSADGEPPVIKWLDASGQPLGVPVIHFRNRGSSIDSFGLSELENVIPLQDALNGTMVSMVATTLLTGFPIRGLVGAPAPAAVAPGLTLSFFGKDSSGNPTNPNEVVNEWLKTIQFLQWEAAQLEPFIAQAEWLKAEMFAITNTPNDDVSADASGEARKQSEVKLLGKVNRFCVRNGNAWEDAVRMAAKVDMAFNGESSAPEFDKLTAVWADPQVRNDSATIADVNTLFAAGIIPVQEARRQLQSIFSWTDEDIAAMEMEDEQARAQQMEDQANQADADMVQGVLDGMKRKKMTEAAGGGEKAAA